MSYHPGDEPDVEYVVFESMPDQHRESHRAARNWGTYPANGAERCIMRREMAEEMAKSDRDNYDHIVRDARPKDHNEYPLD